MVCNTPANACFIILFLRSSRCKGRGGSVSRRDHNQLAGKRAQLAGAHKYVGRDKLIPKPLSGREREGEAFLRKAASLALPHQSPTRFTAGEEEDDEEG